MSVLREAVLARYLSASPFSTRPLGASEARRYIAAYRRYLEGWLEPTSGGAWLDLGCGQGGLMQLAATYGYCVRGVDISEEMLAVCRSAGLSVEKDDLVHFIHGAETASADVVSAFDVLEHFSKDDGFEVLKQIRRVLRPSGTCLLKLPNAESPWGSAITASDLTHEAAYTPWSLQQLGELAGFASCEAREVGPVGTSLVGKARAVLWTGVRHAYRLVNLVETGAPGSGIYTRVMMARMRVR